MRKIFLILISIALFHTAQACVSCVEAPIESGDIGPGNAPNGWTVIDGNPEVREADFCVFESQNGNVVANFITDQDDAIGTSISGLVPGQTYFIGFEVQICDPTTTGELEFQIDQETYSVTLTGFESFFEWNELIYCFTASNSVIDIVISNIVGPWEKTGINIDYLPCSLIENDPPSSCGGGNLDVDAGTDEEVCTEELLWFEGDFTPFSPTATITWTSDPSDGMDYLSDDSVLNPSFQYDDILSSIITYTFTLEVEDNGCIREDEIEVTVLPDLFPEFADLIFCPDQGLDDLPTTSDNGMTGSWEGQDDFEDYAGEIITLTFVPDEINDFCVKEQEFEVEILELEELNFSLDNLYCILDSSLYILPDINTSGFSGEWDIDEYIPAILGAGMHTFIFTPEANSDFCLSPYQHTIEVTASDTFRFSEPTYFCMGETYEFPIYSLDSLSGVWTIPDLSLLEADSTYTTVFTGDSTYCHEKYTHTFTILDITADAIAEDVSDCTSADGQITMVSSFNLEYSIDNGMTWQTDTVFSGLSIGEYEVLIRSKIYTTCESSMIVNVSGSDLPEIEELIVTDNSDCTQFNGALSIVVASTPTLEFSIDGGDTWSESTNYEPLAPGIYTLEYRLLSDVTCIGKLNFEIGSVEAPIVDVAMTDVSACDQQDGQIIITATGEELMYSIDGGVTFTAMSAFTDLEAGMYAVVVSSLGDNCMWEDLVTINSPLLPEASVLTTAPTACNSDDGQVEIVGTDIDLLEFSMDGGVTWSTSTVYTSMASGTYILMYRLITDVSCIGELEFEIGTGQGLTVSVETVDVSNCDQPNGQIIITATGADLMYSIDGGVTFTEMWTFTDLEAGMYELVVTTDDDNCIWEDIITINSLELPEVTVLSTDPTTCTSEDGQIEFNGTDIDLLEFSIDGGQSWQETGLFTNLSADNYEIRYRLRGNTNCEDVVLEILTSPMLPQIDVVVSPITDCLMENGVIEILSTPTNVEYSIDGGLSWSMTSVFTNLSSGTYDIAVRVIGLPECTSKSEATIESIPDLIIDDVIVTPISDCDLEDGSITVSVDGENVTYELVNFGAPQTSNIFTDLAPGNYEVEITIDGTENCTKTIDVEILPYDCPCEDYTFNMSQTEVNCNNLLGAVEVFLESGETIQWSDNSEDPNYIDLTNGWYYLTITYDEGACIYEDSIYVAALEETELVLAVSPSICVDEDEGYAVFEASGGDGNYMYSLDDENYQVENVFNNLSPGSYVAYVIDGQDCKAQEGFTIELEYEALDFELPEDMTINLGDSIQIDPVITSSTYNDFVWFPTTYLEDPESFIQTARPEDDITYSLEIQYGDNCITTRSINIEVKEPDSDIYIPNIITSNGHSPNSTFFIQSDIDSNIKLNQLWIYDRWGNLVFYQPNPVLNDPQSGWGYDESKEYEQGVYVYLLEFTRNSGKVEYRAGDLTVLR